MTLIHMCNYFDILALKAQACCVKKMMVSQGRLSSMLVTVSSTGIKRYGVKFVCQGCRAGVVVRGLASHQFDTGSIPRLGVVGGLSLLVLFFWPRGFSWGTPVFPSLQKSTFDLIFRQFVDFSLQCPQLVVQCWKV